MDFSFVQFIWRMIFRSSIVQIVWIVYSVVCAIGLLELIELSSILDKRRGVGDWKVLPLLCRSPSIALFCNVIASSQAFEVIGAIYRHTGLRFLIRISFAFISPSTLRSLISLCGLPILISRAICSSKKRALQKIKGYQAIFTWLTSAILIGLMSNLSPQTYRWFANDVSAMVYLAAIGAALLVSALQERLTSVPDQPQREQCSNESDRSSIYICSAVVSIWIVSLLNPQRRFYYSMFDPNMIIGQPHKY